jgi:hypothetical protein
MSHRTVIRTVITPRAITRRVGPAGAGGGATTFAALTDKATADLPAINTPLASALSGKQPLDADLTSWAGVTRAAGFDTFTGTPSSANLRALVTDETGSGALVFGTGPTFVGLTNTGNLNLATGTTFTYGTGIAASHRTALGLGSLATQSGTIADYLTIASASATYLPRLSSITVTGTTPAFPGPLVEQPALLNGRREWLGPAGSHLQFDGFDWYLGCTDGVDTYSATVNDPTDEPWKIMAPTWGIVNGTGAPTLTIDPPTLVPVAPFTGTIALAADQYGRLSPTDMIGLGSYVSEALNVAVNANGGFLTAGTGGTLPLARGGTGSTTASDARIALGGVDDSSTGAALFGAATVAAANTALNISETAGVGPVTASTQNVDTNVGSSIPVAAGTYLIEINTTFSNASSSSGNFRLSFGSNPFTVNPQRIGPALVNETASTAFYGDNTGVGFVGGTNATATKCSVWASGILTFSGSNSIQLRVRNTAIGGTVTCDAYRMTVKKLA